MSSEEDGSTAKYTDPLIASVVISILFGIKGSVILIVGTEIPRKKLFNVFSQLNYALLCTAFLVRSLYFLMWIWPGKAETEAELKKFVPAKDPGMQIGLRVFLLTFP